VKRYDGLIVSTIAALCCGLLAGFLYYATHTTKDEKLLVAEGTTIVLQDGESITSINMIAIQGTSDSPFQFFGSEGSIYQSKFIELDTYRFEEGIEGTATLDSSKAVVIEFKNQKTETVHIQKWNHSSAKTNGFLFFLCITVISFICFLIGLKLTNMPEYTRSNYAIDRDEM
jgi:hypothetical protein